MSPYAHARARPTVAEWGKALALACDDFAAWPRVPMPRPAGRSPETVDTAAPGKMFNLLHGAANA